MENSIEVLAAAVCAKQRTGGIDAAFAAQEPPPDRYHRAQAGRPPVADRLAMITARPKRGSQAIDRTLSLFARLIDTARPVKLSEAAEELELAMSTAHRMVARLEAHGLVVRAGPGRYQPGAVFAATPTNALDTLSVVARPVLRRLAKGVGRTAHLGVMETDMVTYIVKEAACQQNLFTREGLQLEAYCSAIGKVLLSGLPHEEREAYLSGDPLIALTERTIVEPQALREHLDRVAMDAFAIDDEEIEAGLFCIAVPIEVPAGLPCAALSLAGPVMGAAELNSTLAAIRGAAAEVAARLHGRKPHCRDQNLSTRFSPCGNSLPGTFATDIIAL